ncbi:hypothetical protein MBLNU459_g1703t1 [Dothideomycetes sp. NU459]
MPLASSTCPPFVHPSDRNRNRNRDRNRDPNRISISSSARTKPSEVSIRSLRPAIERRLRNTSRRAIALWTVGVLCSLVCGALVIFFAVTRGWPEHADRFPYPPPVLTAAAAATTTATTTAAMAGVGGGNTAAAAAAAATTAARPVFVPAVAVNGSIEKKRVTHPHVRREIGFCP